MDIDIIVISQSIEKFTFLPVKTSISHEEIHTRKWCPNDSASQRAQEDRGIQMSNSVLAEDHLVVMKHQAPNLIVTVTVGFCFPH